MTITQLIKKIEKEYPNIMEDIKTSEYDMVELCQGTEIIDTIVDNVALTLSGVEYKKMTNETYGYFNWCSSKEEVEKMIKVDYFEYKIVAPEKFKNITQYKKYILENC